jgi:hypothetical protein
MFPIYLVVSSLGTMFLPKLRHYANLPLLNWQQRALEVRACFNDRYLLSHLQSM